MRLLFANELGSGPSYLDAAAVIGGALAARGHDVRFAVRSPVAAQRSTALAGRPLLQAPLVPPQGRGASGTRDFADVLLGAGYGDPDLVAALLSGWLALVDATGADAMVVEHAPLALLAAHLRRLPAVALGTGFTVPPPASPLPALRPGTEADAGAETTLLEAFSVAARRFGGAAPQTLAALFPAERCRLMSLPEFDHHARRDADACAGVLVPPRGDEAVGVEFPLGEGPRTLVYRHPSYDDFDRLLAQLAATGWPSLVVAPGIEAQRARALGGGTLRIVDRPLDLDDVLARTEQVVVHGGHGSTTRAVLAGLPCLVLPWVLEQAVLGQRLEASGLALLRTEVAGRGALEQAFAQLGEPRYREARSAFAARHAGGAGRADPDALAAWLERRLQADRGA